MHDKAESYSVGVIMITFDLSIILAKIFVGENTLYLGFPLRLNLIAVYFVLFITVTGNLGVLFGWKRNESDFTLSVRIKQIVFSQLEHQIK